MDNELEQLRNFYQDVSETFRAPGMTPFKICKAIWRLVGKMSSWYALNPPNKAINPTPDPGPLEQSEQTK